MLHPASAQNVFPSSGNVGIGTSSPTRLLTINGAGSDGAGTGDFVVSSPGGIGTSIAVSSSAPGGRAFSLISTGPGAGAGAGKFGVFDSAAGAYRMVLDAAGNVGIGTTNPGISGDGGTPTILHLHGGNGSQPYALLDLSSSATAAGYSTGAITFGTTSASVGQKSAEIVSYLTGPSSSSAYGNLTFYTSNGPAGMAERMRVTESGNVGIGTTAPGGPLHVIANQNNGLILQTSSAASNLMAFVDGSATPHTWWVGQGLSNTTDGVFTIYDQTGGVSRLNILRNGNVGIGTTSPAHTLHVAGTIGAQEVVVSSTGADYVFEPRYRLQPLSEVSAYVQANRHLPDIPPASDAQAKGISVGDMQTKLLAKIEELTLYMIHEHERNDRLERTNEQLWEEVTELRGRLSAGSTDGVRKGRKARSIR